MIHQLIQKMLNKIDSLLTRQRVIGYARTMLISFIVFLILFTAIGLLDENIFKSVDFSAFYTAGIVVKESVDETNINLYDYEKQKAIQEEYGIIESDELPAVFLNPPLFAWLMVPFTKMPYVLALNIWRVASVLVFLASVILFTIKLNIDIKWWDTLTIFIVSMPGFVMLFSGQNTFIFIGLYAISFLFLSKGQDFKAGLILGFGALKPQLFIFLPIVFVLQKRWNALIGFTLNFTLITLASIMLIGFEGILEYIRLFDTNLYMYGIQTQVHQMYSLPAFIRLLFGLEIGTTYLALLVFPILVIVFVYYCSKGNCEMDISSLLSLSILGTIISTPHLFYYDLSLLLLPCMVIYSWSRAKEQDYYKARNYRLILFAIFVSLWVSLFATELIRIQIPVLLIIYLFIVFLQKPVSRYNGEVKLL